MPDRIVRAAILTSDRVDQLDYQEEVFYRRLINVVDDFGRFHARLSILKAACFPLRTDRLREADISRWIATCVKAGLIALYEAEGKPYLVLLNLGDRRRAKRSKFPEPPPDLNLSPPICQHVPADASTSHTRDDTCQHVPADDNICRRVTTDSDSDAHSYAHSEGGKPPNPKSHTKTRENAEGPTEGPPEIVVQARKFIQDHPRLPLWNQAMQDNLVQLVTIKNWAYAEAAVEQNINEGSKDPIGDALRRVKRSAAKSDKAEADKKAVLGPTVTVKI